MKYPRQASRRRLKMRESDPPRMCFPVANFSALGCERHRRTGRFALPEFGRAALPRLRSVAADERSEFGGWDRRVVRTSAVFPGASASLPRSGGNRGISLALDWKSRRRGSTAVPNVL